MICTNCGNQLSETAKFCPVCGTVAAREQFVAPQEPVAPQPFVQPEAQQTPAQPFVQKPFMQPEAQQPSAQSAAQQPFSQPEVQQPSAQSAAQQSFSQPAAQQPFSQVAPAPQAPQPPYPGVKPDIQATYPMQQVNAGDVTMPVKPAKPKKSKKWLIPVISVAVVAIGLLTFWLVYTSRPSYKVKKAFEDTFRLDGLLEKLNATDIIKNGSGTIDADLSMELGDDVDSFMGYGFSEDDKPTLKYKVTSDASAGKTRGDLRLGLPSHDMNMDLSLYLDNNKIIVALPGILTESLSYDFSQEKNGLVKEKLGQNYESVRVALSEMAKLASTSEELVKAGKDTVDRLWSTLNDIGYVDVPETELEQGESGYMVTVSGEQISTFFDQAMSLFTQALEKTGTKASINTILAAQRNKKDFDDLVDEMSKQLHRSLDDGSDYEVYFIIKNGLISNLRVKRESARNNNMLEFIGKEGDYPLQNCVFLMNGYGYVLRGKTRTDGIEKVSLCTAYKSGKKSVDEGYEILSYTYNKSTTEFDVNIGDTVGGDHRNNLTSFDFDAVELKGTIEEGSGARTIVFKEIDLYRNNTQALRLTGSVKYSGETNVEEITGKTMDIDSADDNDIQGLVNEVSSYLSNIIGYKINLNSLFGNLSYGNNYYDYDYGYDDYDYGYDYGDYDDYYDYDDYDFGDYDIDYDDIYSALEGLDGLDYGDLFSSLY